MNSCRFTLWRSCFLWRCGFFLLFLLRLLRLLPRDDPHPALFDNYQQTVHLLAQGGEGAVAPALRAFELILLREIGVLPSLRLQTLNLQAVQAAAHYEAGRCFEVLKDTMQARKSYQDVIEKFPMSDRVAEAKKRLEALG